MIPRQGTLIVCDDMTFSLTGKINFIGSYTGDITISEPGMVATQLVFFFIFEGDLQDPPQGSVTVEVTLPGEESKRLTIPGGIPAASPSDEGRTRWYTRLPLAVQQVKLRPGKIEAKVTHDKGETILGAPWIVLHPAATRAVE